jgi:hypothetical protein
VPPKVVWHVDQPNPVRLCGPAGGQLSPDDPAYVPPGQNVSDGSVPLGLGDDAASSGALADDPEIIRVYSDPLPPGWNDAILAGGALTDGSRKLEIVAQPFKEVPEPEENVLAAHLKITSRKLVFKPVDTLDDADEPDPLTNIDWVMQTASPFLGTQVVTLPLQSRPLEVSCYFCNFPKDSHPYQSAKRFVWTGQSKVAFTPAQAAPRSSSKLGLKLKYSRDWRAPQVHWYFRDEFESSSQLGGAGAPGGHKLDDKVVGATLLDSTYSGPTKKSWEENGKPTDAPIVCVVGPETREHAVGPEHRDLYFSKPIEESIKLAGPRKAALKITIGPTSIMEKGIEQLDLTDGTYGNQALLKTFRINIEY